MKGEGESGEKAYKFAPLFCENLVFSWCDGSRSDRNQQGKPAERNNASLVPIPRFLAQSRLFLEKPGTAQVWVVFADRI